MENPDEFLKREALVWTPEKTGSACISREEDAYHLDIADKSWQGTIDGLSKGITGLDSEVQRKKNDSHRKRKLINLPHLW